MKIYIDEYGKLRGIIESGDPIAKMRRVGDDVSISPPSGGAFNKANYQSFIENAMNGAEVRLDPSGYGYEIPFEFPVARQCRKVSEGYVFDRDPNMHREGGYSPSSVSSEYWEYREVVDGVPGEWYGRFTEPLGEVIK